MSHIALPSYLEQSPAVSARFAKLIKRPVILEVPGVGEGVEDDRPRAR